MTTIRIDMQDFNAKLNKTLQGVALDVENALKDKLNVNGSIGATGHLKNALRVFVDNQNIKITMPFYGQFVEWGTPGEKASPVDPFHKGPQGPIGSPRFPPPDALKEWVAKKFHDLPSESKRTLTQEEQVEQSAFALAAHIEAYGTKAHPFIRPVLYDEFQGILKKNLARHFK